MKFTLTQRKQTASFRIVSLMLVIAPLWLMLATANTSVYGQTSDNTPSPGDWTQFLRDNMQRWNPYETVVGVNNAGDLQLIWKDDVINSSIVSSPAVVNGVVYFGAGSDVFALNASTGAKLWSYPTGGGVDSSPAVVNGVVYVGSFDKNIYALNASTGAKLWSFLTGGQVESSPTVVNGVVYIGSDDNNIYALNASTGAKLWSFTTGNSVQSSPAVANGVVYVGSPDHNVYALNGNTGAKLWSYATGGEVNDSAAVANGVVYVGASDGTVYALNASTGAFLWSYAIGSLVETTSPAVANGVVYFGALDFVVAVNANTGAFLWLYAIGASTVATSPAVANGVVYVTTSRPASGQLLALDASAGFLLSSFSSGYSISSPTIVNGVVYASFINVISNNINAVATYAFGLGSADLFLRVQPSATTVHQGDLLTYAFPVWNLGPDNADQEVLNTQVPAGTTFDYIRISGTPGLGTCTHPPYQRTGQIICHENSVMALNTTWTVRLTVKVTAPAGTVITENAATMATTPDPNMANNTATVSLTVQ
jgi:uncharacterized repeat protein (TIGR01451 family)